MAAALLGLSSLKGFPKGFAVTFLLGVGGAIGFLAAADLVVGA